MLRAFVLVCLLAPVSATAQNGPDFPPTQYTGQRFVHDVRSAALGMAGAFLPDATPLALVENPARLAEGGVDPQLRITGSGHPNYAVFDGISTAHVAASHAVGPVVIGGIISNQSFGTQVITDELGESLGESEFGDGAIALAAAVRLGGPRAYLDVGLTGRVSQIRTGSGFYVDEGGRDRSTQPSADVGMVGSVDVIEPRALPRGTVAPTLTVSAGYTQRYIGPDFKYTDQGARGLQPRVASLGTSLQFGVDASLGGHRLQALAVEVAVEAEAEMEYTEFDANGTTGTLASGVLIGQMRARDALLGTSADPFVTGQRGVRVTAAETVWIGGGELNEGGSSARNSRSAWGVGVSVGGALRLAGALRERGDLVELGRRFDLTLGYAQLSGINGFRGLRLGSLGVAAKL